MALGDNGELEVRRGIDPDLNGHGTPPLEDATPVNSREPLMLDLDAMKGRIAEALVEQLFIANGFTVFRYGMDSTVPASFQNEDASVAQRMPGLVALKGHDTVFLEVRFVANEEFGRDDLPSHYPYDDAYVIVVSKEHIKCATVRELNEGHRITPTSPYYLGEREGLGLDEATVNGLCRFATRLFKEE
jgi:hypothetical protein